MPNRTIYVADADIPLFAKAQKLAGGSLSAAITEALKRFVEAEEVKEVKGAGFAEVVVEVGDSIRTYKRFHGRLLAKGSSFEEDATRKISYTVYQTPRENLVVYSRNSPDFHYWSNSGRLRQPGQPLQQGQVGSQWSANEWEHEVEENSVYRLEVYTSLTELEYNVPPELYATIVQLLREGVDEVEELDI